MEQSSGCALLADGAGRGSAELSQCAMDVGFRDLTYTARKWYRLGDPGTRILHGLSGTFKAGRLTAIMGPSGAGKSSLLNVLSGYRRSGIGGSLLLGESTRSERQFRKVSCYLTQEDVLQPLLTTRELMLLAAELKMPTHASRQHREETVDEILRTLGLWESRETRTEALSGGQKKRLSVALELVNNPPVFFLDEPTSGLDEVSAKQCVRLLRDLSRQGRCIVCTLHTPSASLLALVDHVYVVARGRCVYQGPSTAVVSFLAAVNLPCPVHYNPADYLVEVTDGEDSEVIDRLCAAVDNGRVCWQDPASTPAALSESQPPAEGTVAGDSSSESGSSESDIVQQGTCPTASYKRLRSHYRDCTPSGWRQFCLLCQRMTVQLLRNKVALSTQLIHHLLCAFMVGIVFYKCANNGHQMFEHMKFCVGIVLFHSYTWCMVQILIFPNEVKLLKKEHFNRWYRLLSYYLAAQLTRVPSIVFFSMVFLSIIYLMTGLPLEIHRFLLFCLVGIITSLAAEGLGYAVGSFFSITNGCAVGPAAIAPFLGLAVYGFDFARDIPPWMNMLMQLSFMRSGAVAIVLTVFGMNRAMLECNDIYCHYADPRVILRMVDIQDTSICTPIAYICALMLFFRALCYIGLRWRLAN